MANKTTENIPPNKRPGRKPNSKIVSVKSKKPVKAIEAKDTEKPKRGYTVNPDIDRTGIGGQPRAFKDEAEFIETFSKYIDCIRENNYDRLPTQTNFCRWMDEQGKHCARLTVYRTINEYCSNIKDEYVRLLSDALTEGATLGKYRDIMTIFCLKNWCNWADKQEQTVTNVIKPGEDMTMEDKAAKLVELRKKQA